MSKIVNLKQIRKAKARTEKDAVAEANRVHHGTPKALRTAAKVEQDKAKRDLDGHRRDQEA